MLADKISSAPNELINENRWTGELFIDMHPPIVHILKGKLRFSIRQISVHKKTQRSDTIILGILAHFRHFRHFPGLSGLGIESSWGKKYYEA